MNKGITIELQFFMISILWGALVLLAYDLLRILRRIIRHNVLAVAIQDLLFWVLASVFIFALIY
ncbi:MAG: spore cortex biosynthesis protein YabQ, partial [Herbinix sp.]|nr:spore cortex biosynthesis protein YabQ [Herbinix sp.]